MEQISVEQMQQFWSAIDEIKRLSTKVDRMYSAVIGDAELKQIGVIEQQEKIKSRLDEIEKQLEQMDKLIEKTKGYIAGALAVGGVAGSVITLLIKSLLKI